MNVQTAEGRGGRVLRTDALILPEVMLNDVSAKLEILLRPLFDIVWNAFGHPRSYSFDQNGKYRGA